MPKKKRNQFRKDVDADAEADAGEAENVQRLVDLAVLAAVVVPVAARVKLLSMVHAIFL